MGGMGCINGMPRGKPPKVPETPGCNPAVVVTAGSCEGAAAELERSEVNMLLVSNCWLAAVCGCINVDSKCIVDKLFVTGEGAGWFCCCNNCISICTSIALFCGDNNKERTKA